MIQCDTVVKFFKKQIRFQEFIDINAEVMIPCVLDGELQKSKASGKHDIEQSLHENVAGKLLDTAQGGRS
ncbi:MAG TPA: hypothetical protein HPQ00_17245 [Magnetococcales bacterium]|nr:hypothetical protein [Magnetococcales bacterium]